MQQEALTVRYVDGKAAYQNGIASKKYWRITPFLRFKNVCCM